MITEEVAILVEVILEVVILEEATLAEEIRIINSLNEFADNIIKIINYTLNHTLGLL